MRAQERQLAWVRIGMALVAAPFLLVYSPLEPVRPILVALLLLVAGWSAAMPWLLTRFPSREVGIVTTAIDMAVVTIVVYVAGDVIDAYLFYGLVILGTALRFGLGASIWASIVMSGLYVAVVLSMGFDVAVERMVEVRIAYIVAIGVIAGLFSRVVIQRAMDNARLLQQIAEDARESRAGREREVLSRLGRDFGGVPRARADGGRDRGWRRPAARRRHRGLHRR